VQKKFYNIQNKTPEKNLKFQKIHMILLKNCDKKTFGSQYVYLFFIFM